MIIGTRLPTVADTQRNHSRHCGLYDEPWSIANHINWYQHCKSHGGAFHERRWGNHKAAVSRNKREGKYIGHADGKAHRAVRLGQWQYNLRFCKYPGWAAIRVHLRY